MAADPIDVEASAALLRVLANPARLRIVLHLMAGECAVADLEADLGLRQPILSQQLAALRDAGLVATRREARSVFYRLTEEAQRLAAAVLHAFGGAALPAPPVPAAARRRRARYAAVFATVKTP
ncbi:ArsR/SmtB family transcription factor [Rhodopila globiformis]|uniref:HTH arsR-type domain-containing protein n=1 Tax=Rhodopila globiformis TaxID=1071 RepID=A0A2S6NAL1_RHOGL|nr:metalloregulator ArsR/SmtB family transcription factor [Rhodopila globiformis]PPQ31649.1 hypothetical protein CCS01_17025 [Rhodopila globiformis]